MRRLQHFCVSKIREVLMSQSQHLGGFGRRFQCLRPAFGYIRVFQASLSQEVILQKLPKAEWHENPHPDTSSGNYRTKDKRSDSESFEGRETIHIKDQKSGDKWTLKSFRVS